MRKKLEDADVEVTDDSSVILECFYLDLGRYGEVDARVKVKVEEL